MELMYAPTGKQRKKSQSVDVDLLLKKKIEGFFVVQTSEDSEPFELPEFGVKLLRRAGDYVTLRLSERKAINYNLV